jgi:hypothetical protein
MTSIMKCNTAACNNAKNGDHNWCADCYNAFVEKIKKKKAAKALKAKTRPCAYPGCDKAPAEGWGMCDVCFLTPKVCSNRACDRIANKGHSMCNACHAMLSHARVNRKKWHRPKWVKAITKKPRKRNAADIRIQEEAAFTKREPLSDPPAHTKENQFLSNVMKTFQIKSAKVMPFNPTVGNKGPPPQTGFDLNVDEID